MDEHWLAAQLAKLRSIHGNLPEDQLLRLHAQQCQAERKRIEDEEPDGTEGWRRPERPHTVDRVNLLDGQRDETPPPPRPVAYVPDPCPRCGAGDARMLEKRESASSLTLTWACRTCEATWDEELD